MVWPFSELVFVALLSVSVMKGTWNIQRNSFIRKY